MIRPGSDKKAAKKQQQTESQCVINFQEPRFNCHSRHDIERILRRPSWRGQTLTPAGCCTSLACRLQAPRQNTQIIWSIESCKIFTLQTLHLLFSRIILRGNGGFPTNPPPHTGQVGATTTCSQNKHGGEFLYFKLPKLPVQVKSRAIEDVNKYVLNTDVQFTN